MPLTDLAGIVDACADAMSPFLDRPFAFFGHSMGALLGFELTRRLAAKGASLPSHLFVSARRAPHLPDPEAPIHDLSDTQFVSEIERRYGAASVRLLADPELRNAFLPILRADFRAVETYSYVAGRPLECPITAFGGIDDQRATEAELDGWRSHTDGAFALQRFAGDHFFHQAAPRPVVSRIHAALAN